MSKVEIGSRYLENVRRVTGYVAKILNGEFFEEEAVIILPKSSGRCYSPSCKRKQNPSDTLVSILRDDGQNEHYAFHFNCIEELVQNFVRTNN